MIAARRTLPRWLPLGGQRKIETVAIPGEIGAELAHRLRRRWGWRPLVRSGRDHVLAHDMDGAEHRAIGLDQDRTDRRGEKADGGRHRYHGRVIMIMDRETMRL